MFLCVCTGMLAEIKYVHMADFEIRLILIFFLLSQNDTIKSESMCLMHTDDSV